MPIDYPFSRWLGRPNGKSSKYRHRGADRRSLRVEPLEHRRMLTVDVLGRAEVLSFGPSGGLSSEADQFDFGDALDPTYPTVLPNGARHEIVAGFSLGTSIDSETDGQPTAAADGDDSDGGADEDGIGLPPAGPNSLTRGNGQAQLNVEVRNTAFAEAFLDAWIDFDRSGSWEPDEKIHGAALPAGSNTITFAIPDDAVLGDAAARFRLSSSGGLTPDGEAADGEVEDHLLTILGADVDAGTHVFLEDSGQHTFFIDVTGGAPVEGLQFDIQLADGGPHPDIGGTIVGPGFVDVDIVSDPTLLFNASNTGQRGLGGYGQFWDAQTSTNEGVRVTADGPLAKVTIDTTGFFADDANNPWDLKLKDTVFLSTHFPGRPDVASTITNGQIILKAQPIADPNGPYDDVPEGGSVQLDGTASHAADSGDSISLYEWDLDGDGVFGETGPGADRGDEVGATPTFDAAGLDGPGARSVELRVTDNHGFLSDPVSADVNLINVAPAITSVGVDPAAPVVGKQFDLTVDFTDPGAPDTHEVTVDWGDGTAPQIVPVTPGDRTRTVSYTYAAGGDYDVTVTVEDDETGSDDEPLVIGVQAAAIVGRYVFYNDSAYDDGPAADEFDDDAIAPDPDSATSPGLGKTALLPGQAASFQNITSYDKGLNGIMVDVMNLVDPVNLDASDFALKMGNTATPSGWDPAPSPTVTVRPGEGAGGSDRVSLVWRNYSPTNPDPSTQAVAKQWIEVTVLPTPRTGLAAADVFYFGNAVGDSGTGNSSERALVSALDFGAVRDNPHNPNNPAAIDDFVDFNRDQQVNAIDFGLVRDNPANPNTAVLFFTPPLLTGPESGAVDRRILALALESLDDSAGDDDDVVAELAVAQALLAEFDGP